MTSPLAPQPSDQVLREAILLANGVCRLEPGDDDLAEARLALDPDHHNSDTLSTWSYVIIGYVTVATREGRA